MSALKNSITIPRDVSTENDLDFDYLRRIGIQHIASLGGGLWTDFNEHDPGITMLEMLSYAITDLGNRISLPIPDLLAENDGSSIAHQFYTAEQILPNRAVTALDYRKIFMDIDGVRNCWIMPYEKKVYADCQGEELSYDPEAFADVLPQYRTEFMLKGLNRILVDFDVEATDPAERAQKIDVIKSLVWAKYHENRNLCEDLIEIEEVEDQGISICAHIEVEDAADEDDVHARILFAIENYFSPSVPFYSLKQMLGRGYRMDEIFEGPLLESGFIDTEELRTANLRTEVRLSDIIRLIMAVPGVKQIVDISIGNCSDSNNPNDWLICIKDFRKPVVCDKSMFSYRKDRLPVRVNMQRADQLLAELKAAADAYDEAAAMDRFPKIPEGEYLDAGWYTTIQNDFPDTYGISPDGLMPNADTARKSQSKQLKAYLLFFDQVLASYFAHLANAKDLLAVDSYVSNTYFTQAVKDISGFSELVENYDETNNQVLSNKLFAGLVDDIARRNEVMDHLLSRFAESFSAYAFLMKGIYGSFGNEMVLRSKETFLREYVTLSSERGLGFNYYHQPLTSLWNTDNVTGVEKRVARLSGMKNYHRRSLSNSLIEIYESTPGVFKWRIRNLSSLVILSSDKNYATFDAAEKDLYFAVLQLIETSDLKIKQADAAGYTANQVIDNVQVKISGGSNYYFLVVNPALPPSDPNFVLARQYLYFTDPFQMTLSVLNTISFMRNDFTEEGMFVVEHIILRPDVTVAPAADAPYQFLPFCADDCSASCCGIDPYSFRVSIVLPGYTQRFADIDFRNFMEELIREELPSHILAKICWVGSRKGEIPDPGNQLMQFENSFKNYLFKKTYLEQAQDLPTLLPLIDNMTHLNTIFPEGRLHDCENDDSEGDIVLGRTKLGTL